MTTLKGMTWDHARGYDPMAATAAAYARDRPDVRIVWEKRPLQAFADFPLQQLADEYDLIVIDHPHVGLVARAGCLVALDGFEDRRGELAALAAQSLGGSHESYRYDGRQWALAIDAAAQVASYRPDLLAVPPTTWGETVELARRGKVLWPIKPVDALMSCFTLCANLGAPCRSDGGAPLVERSAGVMTLEAMADLARLVPRECLSMNPIEAYERMAGGDEFWYCPLGYGYTNYARDGYRGNLLHFADIPALGGAGPIGSCLGGTGIAVSSRSADVAAAVDYAFSVASAACQSGLYFEAGGQPGNAAAWDDARCDRTAHGFFTRTRATLDAAYVRPRYDGYLDFQAKGGDVVNAFLAGRGDAAAALDRLESVYREGRR